MSSQQDRREGKGVQACATASWPAAGADMTGSLTIRPPEGTEAGSVSHAETGLTCIAVACASTDTRRYLNGPACDEHSPWALAVHKDPRTQIDPERTDTAMRISSASPWAMGGTDLDKTRPGGYVSRQRAVKLAAQRDATSALQHPTRKEQHG